MLDTTKKFDVCPDHENPKYFQEPHKLNRQQARWYLKLQDYNFTLWYILEKTNTKANILSRKDQVDTKDDNKNVQILKDEIWMRWQITAEIKMIQRNQVVEETTLLEEIWKNSTKKQEVLKELDKNNGQS